MSEAHFDRWQFDLRINPVSRSSEIAWADYERMHTEKHDPTEAIRRFVPEWAKSNIQTRLVLLSYAYWYAVYDNRRKSFRARSWRYIDRLATKRILVELKSRSKESRTHAEAVQRFGSVLTMVAALIYRRYRLMMDAHELAVQMRIHAPAIRQIFYRVNQIARLLGFETFERHESFERKVAHSVSELWKNPKYRKHMVEAHRGRRHSRKTRERMRLAKLGKKKSPETIRRMRIAAKLRWKAQRAA